MAACYVHMLTVCYRCQTALSTSSSIQYLYPVTMVSADDMSDNALTLLTGYQEEHQT